MKAAEEQVVIQIDENDQNIMKTIKITDDSVDVWEEKDSHVSSDTELLLEAERPSSFPMFLSYLLYAFVFGILLLMPAIIIRGSLNETKITGWLSVSIEDDYSKIVYYWSVLLSIGWAIGCGLLSLISFFFALFGYMSQFVGLFIFGNSALIWLGFLSKIRIGTAIMLASVITFEIAKSSKATPFGIYRIYASAIALGFLFILKAIIIGKIGNHYFSKYLGKRVSGNKRALKILAKLWDYYLPDFEVSKKHRGKKRHENAHITYEQSIILGTRLYEAISRETGSINIQATDFSSVLDKSDSDFFVDYVDIDDNGNLMKNDFEAGVKLIFEERKKLHDCFIDSDKMLSKLNVLGMGICFALTAMMTVGLFDLSVTNQVLLQANMLVVMKFFFEDVFTRAFQCLAFVFFQHTIDVGDSIFLNGSVYRVKKIGLWETTMTGLDKSVTYFSNLSLSDSRICNYNRSPPQALEFSVALHSSTSKEQLARMETLINDFILANPRDYLSDDCYVKNIQLINAEAFAFQLQYTHKSNFVDRGSMHKRHNMIMDRLHVIFKDVGIMWAPYSLDLPLVAVTPH